MANGCLVMHQNGHWLPGSPSISLLQGLPGWHTLLPTLNFSSHRTGLVFPSPSFSDLYITQPFWLCQCLGPASLLGQQLLYSSPFPSLLTRPDPVRPWPLWTLLDASGCALLLSTTNLLLHCTKEQSRPPFISFLLIFFHHLSACLPRCLAKPFPFFVFLKHECFEPWRKEMKQCPFANRDWALARRKAAHSGLANDLKADPFSNIHLRNIYLVISKCWALFKLPEILY